MRRLRERKRVSASFSKSISKTHKEMLRPQVVEILEAQMTDKKVLDIESFLRLVLPTSHLSPWQIKVIKELDAKAKAGESLIPFPIRRSKWSWSDIFRKAQKEGL